MVHSWMGEFIFRCTQTQITALMKHISCQNYINSITPSWFRPVVHLAQHSGSSGSKRYNIERSHNPSHCPYEAAPPSSHFWCRSLISHVLLERQRPELHSCQVHVRLLYRAKSATKMSFLFCPWYLFWWWAAFCWLLLMISEQFSSLKWQFWFL